MNQPAGPGPGRALSARDWPAPASPASPRHRSQARRWITAVCLALGGPAGPGHPAGGLG